MASVRGARKLTSVPEMNNTIDKTDFVIAALCVVVLVLIVVSQILK